MLAEEDEGQTGGKECDKGILTSLGPWAFLAPKEDTTARTLTVFCLSFFLFFLSFSFWYAIWILKAEEEENPVSTTFYIHYPSKRPRNQIYWYCLCLPNEPFEILKWHQYRFLEELTDINSLAKSELQTSEHLSYLESSVSFLFFSMGLQIGSTDCCACMRKETEMLPKLITGFTLHYGLQIWPDLLSVWYMWNVSDMQKITLYSLQAPEALMMSRPPEVIWRLVLTNCGN